MADQAIRDWTSLPRDVLGYILEKFQTLDEYLLFGRVCTEWCVVVKDQKGWQELSNARMPLLMIPSSEDPSNIRKLYNVVDNKLCKIRISLPYKGRCCGSSHGWVATFGQDMVITLWNLFSGRCIHLPRIFSSPPHGVSSSFPSLDHSGWISKVVLSCDPGDSLPEKCVVGVVYEELGQLAFMRLSDEGWTYVEPWLTFLVYDIFFRDGYLYAIDDRGKLIRIDTRISSFVEKEEAEVVIPHSFEGQASRPYIVESCRGDILMIRRFADAIPPYKLGFYFTMRFDIFKLVTSDEGSRWVEMKSLNDEIIFLGDNQTTSFLCSDFPGSKPNRIYYTDDCFEGGGYNIQGPTDLGMFNVEEGTLEGTYTVNDSELRLPPAIFLMPKLDDKLFLIQQR